MIEIQALDDIQHTGKGLIKQLRLDGCRVRSGRQLNDEASRSISTQQLHQRNSESDLAGAACATHGRGANNHATVKSLVYSGPACIDSNDSGAKDGKGFVVRMRGNQSANHRRTAGRGPTMNNMRRNIREDWFH